MQIFNNTLVKIFSFGQSWVAGITIWPFIFSRVDMKGNTEHETHERIHLKQELECLLIGYLIWYYTEYLIKRIKYKTHKQAYYSISFEREAYTNQSNTAYLKIRKPFSWVKYIKGE